MGKRIDITGQKFGRLTALYPTDKRDRSKNVVWVCQCECGKITEVGSGRLRSGSTNSCGCLRVRDLTGQVFGRLTAIRPTEYRSGGPVMWLCQCSCTPDRFVEVCAEYLRSRAIKSCGCLRVDGSFPEEQAEAAASFENEKLAQHEILKKRISEL